MRETPMAVVGNFTNFGAETFDERNPNLQFRYCYYSELILSEPHDILLTRPTVQPFSSPTGPRMSLFTLL